MSGEGVRIQRPLRKNAAELMHPKRGLWRKIAGPFSGTIVNKIDVPRIFAGAQHLPPLLHGRAASIPVMQRTRVGYDASGNANVFFFRAFFRHPHDIRTQR